MATLQSLIVYIGLFLLMFVLAEKSYRTKNNLFIFVGIICFSIVFGLRYGVGNDFFAYLRQYEDFRLYNIDLPEEEIGFFSLMKFIAMLNLHYGFFFGFVAFLQISLLYLSIKCDRYLYRFVLITFFLSCTWLSFCNGLRQIIALCIWIYALRYVEKKQVIQHYLLLYLATLFHSSAYVLFLFYPILKWRHEWFSKVKIQLILLSISLLVMFSGFVSNLVGHFEQVLIASNYGVYLEDRYSHEIFSSKLEIGLGFYITLFLNVLIIIYSKKFKAFLKSDYLTIIYNLFFVGILIKYAFINSHLISRINYYFYGFDFIVGGYFLAFLFYKKSNILYVAMLIYVLTFVAFMYKMSDNTALFIFNFQDSLFYLKK